MNTSATPEDGVAHQYTRVARLVGGLRRVASSLIGEQPEHEAADVREVGDAAAAASRARQAERAEDELLDEPDQPSRHSAGISMTVKNKMMKTSVSTRARGYSRM